MSPPPDPPRPPRPARDDDPYGVARGARVERSAGGVVVRIVAQAPRILLIRDPYRKWGLPKGHLEAGEEEAEAALREVREETGLLDLTLGPDLGQIDWTFRLRGRRIHKFCRFYLMNSPQGDASPQLAEGITECRWLHLEEAIDLVGYENARGVILRAAERIRVTEEGKGPPWRRPSSGGSAQGGDV